MSNATLFVAPEVLDSSARQEPRLLVLLIYWQRIPHSLMQSASPAASRLAYKQVCWSCTPLVVINGFWLCVLLHCLGQDPLGQVLTWRCCCTFPLSGCGLAACSIIPMVSCFYESFTVQGSILMLMLLHTVFLMNCIASSLRYCAQSVHVTQAILLNLAAMHVVQVQLQNICGVSTTILNGEVLCHVVTVVYCLPSWDGNVGIQPPSQYT